MPKLIHTNSVATKSPSLADYVGITALIIAVYLLHVVTRL